MKLSRRRTTTWNLIFQYIVIIISIVSSIVLVPIYLRYIPIDVYGTWLATGNILVWLTALDPGLSSIVQQKIAVSYGRMDIGEIQSYIGSGLLLTALINIVIIVSGFIVSQFMFAWLHLPPSIETKIILRAFHISLIGSVLMLFSFSLVAVNLGFQSGIGVGVINVILKLLSVAVLLLMLFKGFGLLALAIQPVINGGGLILTNLIYLRWRFHKEKLPFRFSLSKFNTLYRLMSVTFAARLAGVMSTNMDLFVIGRYLGPEAVATLNLTRRAPEISRMFVERPALAFMPAISHLAGSGEDEKARTVLLRLMRLTVWLLGFIVGGFIAFNGDFVRLWLGFHLFAGQMVNVLVCLSLLLAVATNSLNNLCFALGNIKGNSVATLVQAAIAMPLIILGVKYFGMLGAVLAPVIAMMAVSVWYFPLAFSRLLKLQSLDYREIRRDLLAVLGVTVPLTLCGIFFQSDSWPNFALAVGAYGLLYAVGLSALSPNLRLEIRKIILRFSLYTPASFMRRPF